MYSLTWRGGIDPRHSMHHHGEIGILPRTFAQHGNLTAAVFLGRGTQQLEGDAGSSTNGASASAAPTPCVAITLWPQPWPIAGSASYSEHSVTVRSPVPTTASNAVSHP